MISTIGVQYLLRPISVKVTSSMTVKDSGQSWIRIGEHNRIQVWVVTS